jgi:hypothetical protein
MKSEFIVHRDGCSYVMYAGLLDQAHEAGLVRVATTLLQAPDESLGCRAIVSAVVQTERGTFGGIGEAVMNEGNFAPAAWTIDAAELRAKAKAFRDALNIHLETVEETFGAVGLPMRVSIEGQLGRTTAIPKSDAVDLAAADAEPAASVQMGVQATSREEIQQGGERPTAIRGVAGDDDAARDSNQKSVQKAVGEQLEDRHQRRATPNQIATITKLSQLLGTSEEASPDLTTVEASMRIAELARLFNDRSPAPEPSVRKK